MMTEPVTISQTDARKLLSAASPDGALLYIYLQSGKKPPSGSEGGIGILVRP